MKIKPIHPDIAEAETLPASFYRSAEVFEALVERVFAHAWHFIGDTDLVPLENYVHPFTLLAPILPEPMLLIRDRSDTIKCISNVCTHRGNLLRQEAGKLKNIVCSYHGRRFDLDGTLRFMPEFSSAKNFPRPCDHLHEFPLRQWDKFLFTSLEPKFELDKVIEIMNARVGFMPLHEFQSEPVLHRDYLVNCHWALYCDNYLEGFHIPFVHSGLNAVLDYGSYATELFDNGCLQIGYADGAEEVFELPAGHPDDGKAVAAYYFWIFPNMMFNFYPWGLSINIIKPLSLQQTKVSFLSYVYDAAKLNSGAGAILDKVEREDEYIVEQVHKGLGSRIYKTGRFSPTRERGVHHFHKTLAAWLS